MQVTHVVEGLQDPPLSRDEGCSYQSSSLDCCDVHQRSYGRGGGWTDELSLQASDDLQAMS